MPARPRPWRTGVMGMGAVMTLVAAVPGVSARPAAEPPDVVGRWTQAFGEDGAAVPVAVEAAVLADGRVLYFDGLESSAPGEGPAPPAIAPPARDPRARLLDLRAGPPQWTVPIPDGDGDLFCSDVTTLPDGRLLMAGGRRDPWLFDPKSATFEPAAPMKYGRWYPHVAVGADGRPTVFGGVSGLAPGTPPGSVRRTETYHADSNTWEENYAGPESENHLPLQPRIVLTPDGRFFYAAVGQPPGPSRPEVDEAMTAFFQFYDPKTKEWSVSGLAPLGARSGAFVVPLTLEPPYDQMTLVTGGGVPGSAPGSGRPAHPFTTLTSIDANGNVTNRNAADLHHARWHSSGVLLPDGKVLAVGGADRDDAFAPGLGRPVLTPELYDPQTTEWTEVAPHGRARAYHHTAMLLPDMRVLVGGGDHDPTFEVWSPPYLFRGPRPTIDRVQKGVDYQETFTITTPDAALVESVLLLRTPSPQHGSDSDQRSVKLEFTRNDRHRLTATAPPAGAVAPPGPYYLVVNKRSLQGPVPSVARLVDVGRTDPAEAGQPYPDRGR